MSLRKILSLEQRKNIPEAIIFFLGLFILIISILLLELSFFSGGLQNANEQASREMLDSLKYVDALLLSIFVFILAEKRDLNNPFLAGFINFLACIFIHPAITAFIAACLSHTDPTKYNLKSSRKPGYSKWIFIALLVLSPFILVGIGYIAAVVSQGHF